MMTNRERILTALRGGLPDHLPWAPRWELWFNAAAKDGRLPEKYRGWPIFDVARDLGLGLKANHAPLFRTEMHDVEVRVTQRHVDQGTETVTEYSTPIGTIHRVYFVTPELEANGIGGRVTEPFVKAAEDYDVARFVIEHTKVIPAYDELEAFYRSAGEDGFAYTSLVSSPVHRFMREWTSYEQSYYELNDHPNEVERLVEVIEAQEWEIVRIGLEAPVEAAELDGNYDIELTPPPIYRQYFLPFHQQVAKLWHDKGRILFTHTDGDCRGLLELIKESGFDVAEAWTPAPMTSVTTTEARRVWGPEMSIWGGLPATLLRDAFPEKELDRFFAKLLLEVAPGRGFVLGSGDNFPTDSSLERINHVTRLVEEYGALPLDVERLKELAGE